MKVQSIEHPVTGKFHDYLVIIDDSLGIQACGLSPGFAFNLTEGRRANARFDRYFHDLPIESDLIALRRSLVTEKEIRQQQIQELKQRMIDLIKEKQTLISNSTELKSELLELKQWRETKQWDLNTRIQSITADRNRLQKDIYDLRAESHSIHKELQALHDRFFYPKSGTDSLRRAWDCFKLSMKSIWEAIVL